ncbi:MAG: CAP domain-containing protein [Pseudomonadota bacterium]
MRLRSLLRWAFSAVLISLIAACEPTTGGSGARLSAQNADAVRARHVDAINALRIERGLRPVQLSARLTAAAMTHARDMSIQQRAWHFGSDGTSPKDRAVRAGFLGRVVGENISESFDDELEVFQSWLADPITRDVMLVPNAAAVGFSWFEEDGGKVWWVQIFGSSPEAPLVARSAF